MFFSLAFPALRSGRYSNFLLPGVSPLFLGVTLGTLVANHTHNMDLPTLVIDGMTHCFSIHGQTLEGDLLVISNSVLASDIFRNYSQPSPAHMERFVIFHPPPLYHSQKYWWGCYIWQSTGQLVRQILFEFDFASEL